MNAQMAIAAGTYDATFNGGAVPVQHARDFVAILNVTAVSGGTPSMTAKFQESIDGVIWIDIPSAAFSAATGATTARLEFSSRAAFVRAVATITGSTPTLTFSLGLSGKL